MPPSGENVMIGPIMKERIKKYWRWVGATVVFLVLVLFTSDLTLVGLIKTQTSVKRLRGEIMELKAKVLDLEASIQRIGKTLVANHSHRQSRPVMADADHMSRGRKQLVTGPKKKGKGRYARKE